MISFRFFLVLLLLAALLVKNNATATQDACTLHKSDSKYAFPETTYPSSVLPHYLSAEEETNGWLPVRRDEIQRLYEKGHAECKKDLAEKLAKNKEYGHATRYPNPYLEPEQIMSVQNQCRGPEMLYGLTGLQVWSFGNTAENCTSTYSSCWMGLLTCGDANLNNIKNLGVSSMRLQFNKHKPNAPMPAFTKWSIRALHIHLRVIGMEIVVPTKRVVKVKGAGNEEDDVIIAQFALTIPGSNYFVEARVTDLVHSLLYEWSKEDLDEIGMAFAGTIFLGGTEERCRPWSKCQHKNQCCSCDEKSFVSNSPLELKIVDGTSKCPADLRAHASLPKCPAKNTKNAGRWISGLEATPGCSKSPLLRFGANDSYPRSDSVTIGGGEWWEVSGNPCMMRDHDPEDRGKDHLFWAPYKCRLHYYSLDELKQCFQKKTITHIHFEGDSISRDLYGTVMFMLGIKGVDADQLKLLTNEKKENHLKQVAGGILLSEGYAWHFDEKIKDLALLQTPQVVISNYAFAHNIGEPLNLVQEFNKSERTWFEKNKDAATKIPYRFFQTAKDLHGKRHSKGFANSHWSAEAFRRMSTTLQKEYESIGYEALDEFLVTQGRFDIYRTRMDGWHFWGTMRMAEVYVLFNALCNE